MAQDPTISPQRPQVSHPRPALQSTPQARGSATISEHINTVGIQISFPIRNGEDQTPVEGIKVHKVKEALRTYSGIQTEKELYPVFVQAANTMLLFLEELGIEDIRPAEGRAVCFHVNDPMEIQQKHQDHVSRRKPDVVVLSNHDVCDEDGSPGDICSQKDLFLGVATKPPSSKKEKPFEWRDVRTFVEFKKAKYNMEPPLERYSSHKYTPPQEKYLVLNILSEPDLDAFLEAHPSSGINPRPPKSLASTSAR